MEGKPYTLKSDGSLWQAGNSVYGLCSAHNHATNPSVYRTDHEHKRGFQYARAIRNRMQRLGMVEGTHYKELSNGLFWPLRRV